MRPTPTPRKKRTPPEGAGRPRKRREPAAADRMEGAEAILIPVVFAGIPAYDKVRLPKAYRPARLDERIRQSRTRVEARLLAKAKQAGVPCPYVLAVGPFDIIMTRLEGEMVHQRQGERGEGGSPVGSARSVPEEVWELSGRYLARLHKAHIAHGDYTPANLMMAAGASQEAGGRRGRGAPRAGGAGKTRAMAAAARPEPDARPGPPLQVIDFGLGFITRDDEDYATDALTMMKALGPEAREAFVRGYRAEGRARVIEAAHEIDRRSRYQERGAG